MTEEQLRRARQEARLHWLGEILAKHVFDKDVQYGSSWKKRGGPGAFMVMARKWDRIEEACQHPKIPQMNQYDIFHLFSDDVRGESIGDDCSDLIGYLMVLLEEMMERGHITGLFGLRAPDVHSPDGEKQKPERRRQPLDKPRSGPPRRRTEQENPRGYDEEEDAIPMQEEEHEKN